MGTQSLREFAGPSEPGRELFRLRFLRVKFKNVKGRLTHKTMQLLTFNVDLCDIDEEDFHAEHDDIEPMETVQFIFKYMFDSAWKTAVSNMVGRNLTDHLAKAHRQCST